MVTLLRHRIQNLTRRVLSRPHDAQAGSAVPLRQALDRIERRSKAACGDGSSPLVPLIELAHSGADGAVDEPQLREIVSAFEEWASAVGRTRYSPIAYYADPCVPMRENVHATYEVHAVPESGGTKVWVELVFANEWGEWPEQIYLNHGGTIRATGVRPRGGRRTYQWGGSSADTLAARPGRTSSGPVWPDPLPSRYLHLRQGGNVDVFDVYGVAYSYLDPCRIEVRRAGGR